MAVKKTNSIKLLLSGKRLCDVTSFCNYLITIHIYILSSDVKINNQHWFIWVRERVCENAPFRLMRFCASIAWFHEVHFGL